MAVSAELVSGQSASVRDAIDSTWMVLWTKARQEKAVARYLNSVAVEYFLPLVPRVNLIRGRRQVSEVPLFPGYVFLRGRLDDAYGAVATKRVCQIIPISDQAVFLAELGHIQRAIMGGGVMELYPFAVVGRRCRVTQGPFLGVEGVIADRLSGDRIALSIGILGQGAALEIDLDLVEALD